MSDPELTAARMAAYAGPGWQYVAEDLERIAVPGGWLYKYQRIFLNTQCPAVMVFVPEPAGEAK